MNWEGKRVTIIGAARQGQAAARWLFRHGAVVTLNDRQSADQLAAARSSLSELPIRWVLGSHPVSLLDETDVVCLSGGIPLDNPIVAEAFRRGIPVTNDTQVFMELVPCRTVGITGSAGKTTTTSLLGKMASLAHGEKAFVGGNIGDPLLNHVDNMHADDIAILEISSFQLDQMTISPQVAAVLNITPNHLDRHGTMEAYLAAKKRLLDFQQWDDVAVLNRDDPGSWQLNKTTQGRLISFGISKPSVEQAGTFMDGDMLAWQEQGVRIPLFHRQQIKLRGLHNLANVLAACALGKSIDLPVEVMEQAVKDFTGVTHRLEVIRKLNGVTWINDSIATAPERTMAAIHSFSEPLILLLGGRDKNLPWEELAALVHERIDHVIVFGEAAEMITSALDKAGGPKGKEMHGFPGLKEAVQFAARFARPGQVVLFSPGGTSFDQFTDFEARGEAFRKWVWELS